MAIKTKKENIRNIERNRREQPDIDLALSNKFLDKAKRMAKIAMGGFVSYNFSRHDLSGLILPKREYLCKNFSMSDFANVDLRGRVFWRCNFSFAINLDKAFVDETTQFLENNFTGVSINELPETKEKLKTNKNNVGKCLEDFSDKEIEEIFKEQI